MIHRIGLDNTANAFDNMYNLTKKSVQDIVTNSYDDIDNIIPNDIVDINFQENDKTGKTAKKQNIIGRYLEKIKKIFS